MIKLWCFDTRSFAAMFSFFRRMWHFAFLYTTTSHYKIIGVFITRLDLYDFTTIPCACWFAFQNIDQLGISPRLDMVDDDGMMVYFHHLRSHFLSMILDHVVDTYDDKARLAF